MIVTHPIERAYCSICVPQAISEEHMKKQKRCEMCSAIHGRKASYRPLSTTQSQTNRTNGNGLEMSLNFTEEQIPGQTNISVEIRTRERLIVLIA